ncbi:MAG TPA: sugar phosphate isomerase/epimerase [Atribacteraceae bacterium]|nr:sugar phosphate isomerase/epimerase [Atribacteraceae bacterium]
MKIGVFMVLLQNQPFDQALDYVKSIGVQAVEIGTGGYPGKAHCDPERLLADAGIFSRFRDAVFSRELELSALSCHGNPVHPDPALAQAHHKDFEKTVLLAEKLGVKTVITFSGCPGDSEQAKYPNWVTCPWPNDFQEIVKWQWENKIIPYWKDAARFAGDHGVRVALEMHPGFSVYNPETLLCLRLEAGEAIGANFDPSHLFWQGMDPIRALRRLEGAIFHVHAKDTKIDPINSLVNGNLDTKPYTEEMHRAWIFRTVGYGHGAGFWKDLVSNLRIIGYEGALSIEHEDSLMSVKEGLEKAVAFLRSVVITEEHGEAWWT